MLIFGFLKNSMTSYRKILLYIPVAFVLIFMGKISKAGLYRAYFRTIADVEFRNSQDLKQSKAIIFKELFADEVVEKVSPDSSRENTSAGFPENRLKYAHSAPMLSLLPDVHAYFTLTLRFHSSIPVRAP